MRVPAAPTISSETTIARSAARRSPNRAGEFVDLGIPCSIRLSYRARTLREASDSTRDRYGHFGTQLRVEVEHDVQMRVDASLRVADVNEPPVG